MDRNTYTHRSKTVYPHFLHSGVNISHQDCLDYSLNINTDIKRSLVKQTKQEQIKETTCKKKQNINKPRHNENQNHLINL